MEQKQKQKLNWKNFSTMTPFQILFNKENTIFLQNIFSHKLTEYEIENLPSFYIISFVEVLQNYIYYFLKNEQGENGINNVPNECEKLINSQNEKIEELKEKIINFQEVINQKDMALNDTSEKLITLYNDYNSLEQDYKISKDKYKQKIEENNENFKEMEDKMIDTFSYLKNLISISNINVDSMIEKEEKEEKKSNSKRSNHQGIVHKKKKKE